MKNKTVVVIISILIACASLVLLLLGNEKLITQSYGLKDNKDIAVFIYDYNEEKYTNSGSIPTGDYTLQEESFCKNGSKIVSYDSSKGVVKYTMSVADKCYLYFKGPLPLSNTVLAKVSDKEYTSSQDGTKYVVMHEEVEHEGTTYDAGVRYEGNDPDNYVTFNGDEEWRIIGVFEGSTIGLEPGKQYTKIIRNTTMNKRWDCSNWNEEDHYRDGSYENDWTNSTLSTYLNGEYLESLIDSNKIAEYNGNYSTWYIRGMDWETHEGGNAYTPDWYLAERITGSPAPNAEASTTGAIGLMYPSDYGYGAYGSNCDNKTSMTLYNYETGCAEVDWLLLEDDYEWLISPTPDDSYSAFFVGGSIGGNVLYYDVFDELAARPVLYLEYDVYITGGAGSKANPYTLDPLKKTLSDTVLGLASYNEYTSAQDKTPYLVKHETVEYNGTTYDAGVRYEGNDPDNYVLFNGNEEWRIIGVFEGSTIGLEPGKQYTKIIRNAPISKKWNEDAQNDWTNSTLNTYLNNDYLNGNGQIIEDDENNDVKSLLSSSKSMIAQYNGNYSTWYLRGTSSYYDGTYDSAKWYLAERITGTSGVYGSADAETTGAIGLMYPSDYGYAAYGSACDNAPYKDLNNYESGCAEVDWLLLEDDYEWLISPDPDYSYNAFSASGYDGGDVNDYYDVSYEWAARPVLYLGASVKIAAGAGTKANPYKLS